MISVIHFSFIFLIAIFAVTSNLPAQWKKVANALVYPYMGNFANPEYGAIHFKDGVLWAGWQDDGTGLLRSSSDTGKTWQKINLGFNGEIITDINFYDKLNGLAATLNSGIFITRNGGATWASILMAQNCINVSFGKSPNIMYVLTGGSIPSPTGLIHTSIDGGASWIEAAPGGQFCSSFTMANNGTLYVVCSTNTSSPGFISASTDSGKTWQQLSAEIGGDSYTICADSTDPKRLYVVNEAYAISTDDHSQLYYSDDAGNSWVTAIQFPTPFFSGAMTCTKNAIYVSSLRNGIYRSIDNGKTWKKASPDSIKSGFDTRNIACVNDNIVFILDSIGNIWETTNGGGDSVIEKSYVLSNKNPLSSSAYPNPSNGQIRIEYQLPEGVSTGELIITNIEGIEIKKYQVGNIFNEILIEKSDLPSGSYFYKLVTEKGESEARKIMILR